MRFEYRMSNIDEADKCIVRRTDEIIIEGGAEEFRDIKKFVMFAMT